jgi:hypothetical protein
VSPATEAELRLAESTIEEVTPRAEPDAALWAPGGVVPFFRPYTLSPELVDLPAAAP